MPFRNKKQTVAFSDILRGLQQAINSAQDILQAQQVRNVQGFFGSDGKPVSQTIRVGEKQVEVPLMTVVPHNNLVMDDVEIKFKTKVGAVSADTSPGLRSASGGELTSANLQMQMEGVSANDSDVMEVTIRFKAKETPEGMSRILDEYNKQI